MKISIYSWSAIGVLLVAITPLGAPAQTSMFSYQGRLFDSSQPAAGTYDFQFRLADSGTNGNYVGPTLTQGGISVTNGVFTVSLDFGPGIFDGSPRFLEAGVRTNGSTADYTILQPLQPITTAPYAMLANTAVAAGVASNIVSGAILTNLTIVGSAIQSGTITSAQMDPATDAAYRSLDTNAVKAIVAQVVGAVASSRWVDAKLVFGAKGDGVTDDTAALQAGLDYLGAASASNMTLYVPPGTYILKDTLRFPPSIFPPDPVVGNNTGCRLTGAGMTATRLVWPNLSNGIGLALTNLPGYEAVTIESLELIGPLMSNWDPANASIGIAIGKYGADSAWSGQNNTVRNCGLLGWGYGAAATNQWGLVFDNCIVASNSFEGLRFAGSHDVSVQHCKILGGWQTACGSGVGFHAPLNDGFGDNAQVMNCFIGNCTNGIVNQELNLFCLNTHLESCGSYFTLFTTPGRGAPATTIIGGYTLDFALAWTNGFAAQMLLDAPAAAQTFVQNSWFTSAFYPGRPFFNVTNLTSSFALPTYWGPGPALGLWNTTSNVYVYPLGTAPPSNGTTQVQATGPMVTSSTVSSRFLPPAAPKAAKLPPQANTLY